jgi:hypothetical protein
MQTAQPILLTPPSGDELAEAERRLLDGERDIYLQRIAEVRRMFQLVRMPLSEAQPDKQPIFADGSAGQLMSVCSPAKIVRVVVRGFGSAQFTFTELCSRIEGEFPGVIKDRRVVSRRLYLLRTRKPRLIEIIAPASQAGGPQLTQTGKERLYQYIGPL